jgi:hypothetical protein
LNGVPLFLTDENAETTLPLIFSQTQLRRLVDRFAAGTIPKDEWRHETHLALALWHIARYGRDMALVKLRTGIRRLNDSHGTPNTDTSGYHETMTRAFLYLVAESFGTLPPHSKLESRLDTLLSGPLARKDVLLLFYSPERLMSPQARRGWVEPDRQYLELHVLPQMSVSEW